MSCPERLEALEQVSIPRGSKPDRRLTPEEQSDYRFVLGVATLLCLQRATEATVADAHALNNVVRLAAARPDLESGSDGMSLI